MSRREVNKGLSSYVVRANLKSLFGRQTKKHPYCMEADFSPVSDGIHKCSIGYFPKRHLYNVCYAYIWDSHRHKKGLNILIFIHIMYQYVVQYLREFCMCTKYIQTVFVQDVCLHVVVYSMRNSTEMPTILQLCNKELVFLVTAFCIIVTFRTSSILTFRSAERCL